MPAPIASFSNLGPVRAHPDYRIAKAGDAQAAARLVTDLVDEDLVQEAAGTFGKGAVYVPVIALEMSGRNQIPLALAEIYAQAAEGEITPDIVQINRAFHTGASAMERLLVRARFEGPVEAGRRYIVVDDASVLGSTLADLAFHVEANGGQVIGAVLLANASRSGKLVPEPRKVTEVERRFGDAVRDIFEIDPAGLTADEAAYLLNFRNVDALRDRAAAAERQRRARLDSKGLGGKASEIVSLALSEVCRWCRLFASDTYAATDCLPN